MKRNVDQIGLLDADQMEGLNYFMAEHRNKYGVVLSPSGAPRSDVWTIGDASRVDIGAQLIDAKLPKAVAE